MAQRQEFAHLEDNENPFAQDENTRARLRELRKEQADKAVSSLNMGNFTTVASQLVKQTSDPACVICQAEFAEHDQVVELECDARHIFHADCLRPWFEKQLTCPICRESVKTD